MELLLALFALIILLALTAEKAGVKVWLTIAMITPVMSVVYLMLYFRLKF